MKKFGIFILLVLISVILAGIYGAIHDQITYSISPEYFTVFKFDQFGFSDWGMNSPRFTTALIGILATWWVGLLLGIVQSLLGLIHMNYKVMFKVVFNAILITVGVTILFGIIGFAIGNIEYQGENLDCCFPYQISDKRNFKIVGSIHNFGYTGGLVGAICGFAYQLYKKKTVA